MIRRRAFAVVLLVIAFLTLAATRAFPFLGDVSGLTETAIVFAGVACGLAGVWLWTRKTPEPES